MNTFLNWFKKLRPFLKLKRSELKLKIRKTTVKAKIAKTSSTDAKG